MSIWLQKSALIQPRTSPLKFAQLAEKSQKDPVPNLSTKVHYAAGYGRVQALEHLLARGAAAGAKQLKAP